MIHDGSGDERGTLAWLSNARALVALDRPGAEAFAAVVNDKTGEAKVAQFLARDSEGYERDRYRDAGAPTVERLGPPH